MRKFVKRVPSKDNPGKRLTKLQKVTVKDAMVIDRSKVILYTEAGSINIAPDLERMFHYKGVRCTEGRQAHVCERLKRKTIEITTDKRKVVNLASFVY